MKEFPRELTDVEREFLYWLLPLEKEGYQKFNEFVQNAIVLGEGRWGEGDLMLAPKPATIDKTLGMEPIVAYGECLMNGKLLTISVHDLNADEQLEAQFGIYPLPAEPTVDLGWCYSYWKSGDTSPASGEPVREILLTRKDKHQACILVISKSQRSMWLHYPDGFNRLMPVTGLNDDLLRTHGIREFEQVSNPSQFFTRIDEFSDAEIRLAFAEYTKRSGRNFGTGEIAV
jgi:hypothetical protein